MKKPLIIGLTGSIGMGKSTVAEMFADQGIAVFDADAVVHMMQGAGGELLGAIELAFPGTTGPQGVNRKALGEAVLGDREKIAKLEAIVHPAVAARRIAFLADHAGEDIVLFDIPLLFETGGDAAVDVIVVVSSPHDVQRERVLARPSMTAERFDQILALQMSDADKRARADFVIDTTKPIDATRRDVRAIVKKLRAGLA